ncbi:UbiH/UbiF/VisC/COQ6 family ubiquinone biosynthesis hydroxylase [Dokdonella koreensis]|uniref:2-octaprenyl-3-methyl-6-methoxy-1,4-benzoquinol hydroxylase n=1 Tax=Dokdonella koreensis DS-123 TaxID=1300342 RepID=A0A167GYD7_9GAMM|nr:UbiH/UbiF/VisC/COQ6 family ubiquinone biosynthesis hydroxylase [Dokdonella koreensis]ANB18166.1 2-octaprenyl-3-methyl-6-methoxy-1,4-benzoquinol hydroxylase [Dokdonella koreensis DS-123]
MSRRGEHDVIVVGAGPVGAALALALAADGFDVAVVEAQPPRPAAREAELDLRVVALAPDAIALLQDLGAWPLPFPERVGSYRRMEVWDATGPGRARFDAAERGEAALGRIVENRHLQHALWTALAGRARVLCPAEAADLDDGDATAALTLADGTRLRARVLVAAEGAESPLRARLGIGFAGRDYGQRAVVAHVATERPHEDTAWQRFLPGGPLAFLPLGDGRSSIVWSLPDAEAARVLALDDAAFCCALGAAFDFRLGPITAAGPRAAFPLRLRRADRYVAGRCVLVGDAAHVVHPLAGQGVNLGLRDVACLRRVLAEARARGSDIGAAHVLRRYERERRSENALAAWTFDAIERVFASTAMPLVLARGLGLEAAGRIGPLRRALAAAAAGHL